MSGLNMAMSAPYTTDIHVPGCWKTHLKEIGNELSRPTTSSGNENIPRFPSWSSQLVRSGLVVILGLVLDDLVL
jgi:hypothetical protein